MHTLMIKAGSSRVFLSPGYAPGGNDKHERRLALVVDGREASISGRQARELAAHIDRLLGMHPRDFNRNA